MGNAKIISPVIPWATYFTNLGMYRLDYNKVNSLLGSQYPLAYILDETDIPIPDIPKYRPTAKRVYLLNQHDPTPLGYDYLGLGNAQPEYQEWINEWMLKGECYVLDEC